jgi:hypothetical protein
MTLLERFEAKISPEPMSGCWLWCGNASVLGYGVAWDGRPVYAHRLAARLYRLGDPTGKVVCHRCDVPSCVNPKHLFLGTQADNLSDMRAKGRGNFWVPEWQRSKTHCLRGHEYSEANTQRYNGKRYCRTCRREAMRVKRALAGRGGRA